jgi:hypothetical protein
VTVAEKVPELTVRQLALVRLADTPSGRIKLGGRAMADALNCTRKQAKGDLDVVTAAALVRWTPGALRGRRAQMSVPASTVGPRGKGAGVLELLDAGRSLLRDVCVDRSSSDRSSSPPPWIQDGAAGGPTGAAGGSAAVGYETTTTSPLLQPASFPLCRNYKSFPIVSGLHSELGTLLRRVEPLVAPNDGTSTERPSLEAGETTKGETAAKRRGRKWSRSDSEEHMKAFQFSEAVQKKFPKKDGGHFHAENFPWEHVRPAVNHVVLADARGHVEYHANQNPASHFIGTVNALVKSLTKKPLEDGARAGLEGLPRVVAKESTIVRDWWPDWLRDEVSALRQMSEPSQGQRERERERAARAEAKRRDAERERAATLEAMRQEAEPEGAAAERKRNSIVDRLVERTTTQARRYDCGDDGWDYGGDEGGAP